MQNGFNIIIHVLYWRTCVSSCSGTWFLRQSTSVGVEQLDVCVLRVHYRLVQVFHCYDQHYFCYSTMNVHITRYTTLWIARCFFKLRKTIYKLCIIHPVVKVHFPRIIDEYFSCYWYWTYWLQFHDRYIICNSFPHLHLLWISTLRLFRRPSRIFPLLRISLPLKFPSDIVSYYNMV